MLIIPPPPSRRSVLSFQRLIKDSAFANQGEGKLTAGTIARNRSNRRWTDWDRSFCSQAVVNRLRPVLNQPVEADGNRSIRNFLGPSFVERLFLLYSHFFNHDYRVCWTNRCVARVIARPWLNQALVAGTARRQCRVLSKQPLLTRP